MVAERKREEERKDQDSAGAGEASDQGGVVEEGQDLFWWGDKALQGTLTGLLVAVNVRLSYNLNRSTNQRNGRD
jgi:hypothetical protein